MIETNETKSSNCNRARPLCERLPQKKTKFFHLPPCSTAQTRGKEKKTRLKKISYFIRHDEQYSLLHDVEHGVFAWQSSSASCVEHTKFGRHNFPFRLPFCAFHLCEFLFGSAVTNDDHCQASLSTKLWFHFHSERQKFFFSIVLQFECRARCSFSMWAHCLACETVCYLLLLHQRWVNTISLLVLDFLFPRSSFALVISYLRFVSDSR